MTSSTPRRLLLLATALAALLPPAAGSAQEVVDPVLRGQVLLGDTALRAGTVILHRVSEEIQGEVDSTQVAPDGSFAFRLPTLPGPDRSDVYFASVRHAGILYFGRALTLAVQLDTVYRIQAWDTLTVPDADGPVALESRSLFLEPGEGGGWQVTDLFQLRNDRRTTLLAPEGGVIWRHPLPPGVTDAQVSQVDVSQGAAEVRDGELVVATPFAPGNRLFVVRYSADDPFLSVPLPSGAEAVEILLREPSPAVEAAGLAPAESVEFEPGTTFRRLAGSAVPPGTLVLEEGRDPVAPPPARWMGVLLALILAGFAAWALQAGRAATRPAASSPAPVGRQALILEIARLDEAFSTRPDPTPEERGAYEARRGELLRRLARAE